MEFQRLEVAGPVIVTPRLFEDDRGFFMESYNRREFEANGIGVRFVQDNHSRSKRGVLRGLHFQRPPCAQDKLVRVTRGEAFDIAVDIRTGSPTFGRWIGATLSEENRRMLFIPKGFAHGFVARVEGTELEYKVSDFYDAASDGGIVWNDPEINIDWGIDHPLCSSKDAALPSLKKAIGIFTYET